MMSSVEIPVISDPQFDLETDKYFLQCMEQHPNLYDEADKDFNNHLLKKYSRGLIAKYTSMTLPEVKQKWESLMGFYNEEENLQVDLSCCDDVHGQAEVTETRFPHYSEMKKLLTHKEVKSTSNGISQKKTTKNSSLMKSAVKQATTLNKQIKQKLTKQLQVRSTDLTSNPNIIAGKIIFRELQNKSSEIAAEKGGRLLDLVAKFVRDKRHNNDDSSLVSSV